tara:strand:- start:29 stop:640 length:612 start_codon:yes stop_codon:yes gene_type:complete
MRAAHGYAAKTFGDATAWMLGRVTLNPLKHIDPIGTVALPMLLAISGLPIIGYARPVPVNFNNLRRWRLHTALVALAGPGANLVLIFLSILFMYIVLAVPTSFTQPLLMMAVASIFINTILMVFNLLPLPPLDGYRVVSVLLPPRIGHQLGQYEQIGMWVVILLVISGILFKIIIPMMLITLGIFWPMMPDAGKIIMQQMLMG